MDGRTIIAAHAAVMALQFVLQRVAANHHGMDTLTASARGAVMVLQFVLQFVLQGVATNQHGMDT